MICVIILDSNSKDQEVADRIKDNLCPSDDASSVDKSPISDVKDLPETPIISNTSDVSLVNVNSVDR